ncbi:hypothetical protein BSKO_00550 [Bryopsis sp. KO-2023]|nr:hypothetical protein BSKO_00550 [Bryopsis sp. KO-2023]
MSSSMGGAAIPDLKLRMSKKIAQLTKVIYQLNNRNEDYEFDMQEMAEQYESEIEQILKDTAEKVNFFKNLLEDKRDEKKVMCMTKKLEEQYEKEKQKALVEFENYKKKCMDREKKMQEESSKQVQNLSEEVKKLKIDLEKRCAQVDEVHREAEASKKGLTESLDLKQTEVEEAIRTGNQKYTQMLAERMGMEDRLKAKVSQLQSDLQSKCSDMQTLLNEVAKTRDDWEAERQRTNQLHKASDMRWKDQVARLLSQLGKEKEISKAEKDRAEAAEHSLIERTEELEEEKAEHIKVQAALQELEELLTENQVEMNRQKQDLEELQSLTNLTETDLEGHRKQVREMTERLKQMSDQSNHMTEAWSEDKGNWEKRLEGAELDKQRLEQELMKIQSVSENTKGSLEMRMTELNDINAQLLAKQNEMEQLRKGWEKEKQAGKRTLVQSQEESQRALLAVENKLKNSHKQIEDLRNKVEEVKKTGMLSQDAALSKMEKEMEEELSKAADAHNKKLADSILEHEKAMNLAETKYTEELERIKQALGLELKSKEEGMEKLQNENEQLQMQHEAALQEIRSKMTMTANNWEDLSKDLQRQIGDLERQISDRDASISSLENELSSTSKDLKNAEQELSEKKDLLKKQQQDAAASEVALMSKLQAHADEGEEQEKHYRGLLSILEADVAALNLKMEEERSAAEREFSSRILQLEDDWKQRCDAGVEEARRQRDAEHAHAMERLKKDLTDQSKHQEDKVAKRMAAKSEDELGRLQQEMQAEREKHEAFFRQRTADFMKEKEELMQQHRRALLLTRQDSAKDVEDTQSRLRSEATKSLQELTNKYDQETAQMKAQHAQEVVRLRRELEKEQEDFKRSLTESEKCWSGRLDSARRQSEEKMESKVRDLEASHCVTLDSERNNWENGKRQLCKTVSGLEGTIARMKQQNGELAEQKQQLGMTLADTRQALVRKTQDMAETIHRMKRENDDCKVELEEHYKRLSEDMEANHSSQVASLEAEFKGILAAEKTNLSQLSERYSNLKHRFETREPRKEDVDKIVALERALKVSEHAVQRSEERMNQLRNEMLLREDNYNKHFKNGGRAEKVLDVKGAMASTKGITDWMIQSKRRPAQQSGKGASRARRETQ